MTIETRDPATLKPHPLNARVYGAEPLDRDLLASVRDHGVLTPLLVTADDVIVSGHRRHAVAVSRGLATVPVVVTPETDELAIERLVLEGNRQRPKTNEQLAREVQALADITGREAARRLAATQAKPGAKVGRKAVAPAPPPTKPDEFRDSGSRKAREDVAARLGIGVKTVDALATAIDAIDEAEAAGDQAEADALRTTLNEQGARPAAKAAREKRRKEKAVQAAADDGVPPKVAEALATRPKWLGLQSRLGAIRKDAEALADGPGGHHCDKAGLLVSLKDAGHRLRFAAPSVVCPACMGRAPKDCRPCRGAGYVNEDALKAWRAQGGQS